MNGSNKIPNHMAWMGKLVVNLQSLEFALRGFLYNHEKQGKDTNGVNFLDHIEEGQELEENVFTNYDSLGDLIKKYNKKVQSKDQRLEVDPNIARIRDALAHGRIAGLSPSGPLRLIKYDTPKNGRVRVTDYYTLTKKWFDDKISWVYENIEKVNQANQLTDRN